LMRIKRRWSFRYYPHDGGDFPDGMIETALIGESQWRSSANTTLISGTLSRR
jgi:hypothetical protein